MPQYLMHVMKLPTYLVYREELPPYILSLTSGIDGEWVHDDGQRIAIPMPQANYTLDTSAVSH